MLSLTPPRHTPTLPTHRRPLRARIANVRLVLPTAALNAAALGHDPAPLIGARPLPQTSAMPATAIFRAAAPARPACPCTVTGRLPLSELLWCVASLDRREISAARQMVFIFGHCRAVKSSPTYVSCCASERLGARNLGICFIGGLPHCFYRRPARVCREVAPQPLAPLPLIL